MTETNHGVLSKVDTVAPKSMMHPLVERMLAKDPTPEALEKILKLQSDWEKSEAKKAYDAALVELKKALPLFIERDQKVDYTTAKGRTHYTHASLAGAMEQVTPILCEYGFSLTWKPGNSADGLVQVTIKLSHRGGHTEESIVKAAADGSGNKNGPQAFASSVTLLARYSALGMLGLATKDMADPAGEAASPASTAEKIDTQRNMKAVAAITKAGKTKAAAEAFVGKQLQQWTAKDLDKLRTWLKPAPVDAIAPEQAEELREMVVRWNLTPEQFMEILLQQIGRKPATADDVRKAEYAKIKKLFDGLELGAFSLVNGKIERPPEEVDSQDAEPVYEKEVPEDKDIPF